MKNRAIRLAAFVAIPLVLAGVVFAHHGTGQIYDSNNPITMNAVVTQFNWANPHAQIYFDVKDDKGNVVHWVCEAVSPGKLARAGWTKNSLKPGDQITITLSPAKAGGPYGNLRKIIVNGKELPLQEQTE